MTASIGDRIKSYEAAYNQKLTPNSCVFIRVDGKSFHTFTRGCDKPFDARLVSAMKESAIRTATNMQGFELAYIQSDECTFMITDFATHKTEGWFGYELNKLVSITASMFTAHFNNLYKGSKELAFFDARAFVVPDLDAPNVFVWRQKDWQRNSIQMLARSIFSHNDLLGKNTADVLQMLHEAGSRWDSLPDIYRYGAFVLRDSSIVNEYLDYEDILERFENVRMS